MYWFDIDELLYYHPNTGGYCYCELLVEPSDLMLQARLPKTSSDVNVYIEAFTPDGVTSLGLVTSLFKGIVAVDPSGAYYANIQLQEFSTLLCSQCFVLKVTVIDGEDTGAGTIVFDKFTQQYCVADCCAGFGTLEAGTGEDKKVFNSFNDSALFDNCGNPLVRIKTTFDCFDNFSGDYYGAAIRKIEGINNPSQTDITFYKITNLPGLFKRLPREVKTTVSLNCKTQKTEGTRNWMLQGSVPVPSWKMDEMEGQLSANNILINGIGYKMQTAVPFEKIMPFQKDNAAEYFRLNTVLYECRIWQIFGCGTNCLNTQRVAYAPRRVGEELYKVFDSDGALIAQSEADFITYLLSQPGITAVTDVSYVYTPYGYQSVLMIESDNGYVPSYFYLNYVGANAKWPMVGEVEDLFSGCFPATLGTVTDAAYICSAAVFGTITDASAAQLLDVVYDFGPWQVQAGSTAALTGPTVRIDFVSRNTLLAGSQAALGGDIVGYVTWQFAPSEERVITANLPTDTYVVVGTDGTIRWFGALTAVSGFYGEVEFNNVTYII